MRRSLLIVLLFAAPPAAVAMDGVELIRLCERDPAPCAGIIREQLKDWPKRVLDPAALRQGRFEYAICPPHQDDTALAGLFVRHVTRQGSGMQGKPMQEAIAEVFTQAFPACASSRDS